MTYIADLVAATVAPRVSAELQPHLRSFYGGIVRAYLPQTWWFSTQSGRATLFVDREGQSQVVDGAVGQPDAEIGWTDAAFHVALTTADRRLLPSGTPDPEVNLYTANGKTAFKQLRQRIGL
ncbi:MAG: hypothetical protein L3K11_03750 [Thermoplasmata archaeon]|nr:hypothetical protein [Thermoplasmata archaeon]